MTNLFKGPTPPAVTAAPAMPNPNDPATIAAAQAAAAKANAYGRSSTVLTSARGAGGTIAGGGAGTYNKSTLGGAR